MQVSVVWWLLEQFKAAFGCKTWSDARQYFQRCFESVQEAAAKEIRQVAEMLVIQAPLKPLCCEQPNAKAECIDEKIQEVKTIGREYMKIRISDLQFSSFAEIWTSIHNVCGRTLWT